MQYSPIISQATNPKHSPDSSYFAYSINNTVYVKESVQLITIAQIRVSSSIKGFQISPDSRLIAIYMNKKSMICIYAFNDPEILIAKIQDTQHQIANFFWAKDSTRLLVFSEYNYKVSIYSIVEETIVHLKSPKILSSKGFSFNSNGSFMAIIEKHDSKDYLVVYYTPNWKIVNSFYLQLFDAVEVRWSPNDAFLIVWDNCISYKLLVFLHTGSLKLKYQPYTNALGIKTVEYAHNSRFMAIGSFDEKIRLLNGQTWQKIAELDCSNVSVNTQKVEIFKEEEVKGKNKIVPLKGNLYKIPTMKATNNEENKPPNQGVGMMQFSVSDKYLACRNDNMPYTVFIWDISKLELYSLITCSSHIKGIKWLKDENTLYIIYGSNKILVWRQNNTIMECEFSIQNNQFNIQKMFWSEDCKKILISNNKSQIIYVEIVE